MAQLLKSAVLLGAIVGANPTVADVATVHSEMLVTTQWLAEHLQDPNLVILCAASSPGFYSEGHIPGARVIKMSEITVKRGDVPNELPPVEQLTKVFRAAGVKEDSRIVIYGDRYNLLAARAYYTLDYLGLADHAALLNGGIGKWKNELRQLSKDIPKVAPTPSGLVNAPPNVNARILVETPAVREIASSTHGKRPILLDARPRAEYTGERHSEEVHKLGHIPGAKHLYWQDLLVSLENPVLLPPEELRKKFKETGAAPRSQVITYCRSGMQSSFDYFVAKYLGYDARMYDASFFEWSAEDLPAEISK